MRAPVLLLALLCAARSGALTLDEFAGDKALWTLPKAELAAKGRPLRFVWVSSAQDTLRADKGGKIFGLDAGETLIRFDAKSGEASGIEISLFNRGDKGEMNEKAFNALLARATEALDKASGEKSQAIRRDRQSAVRADGAVWAGKDATYRLEWSKNRDDGKRPEFLTLHILPSGKAADILKAATGGAPNPAKNFVPADHLETTPAGDKWIKDVPMVDQGQKGYCAVATTERVLRLYGLPVDEHDIAQLADASGDGGTNYAKLQESFRTQSSRLKVRMKVLLDTDAAFLENLANDYNGAARKTKVTPLPNPRTNAQAFYSSFSFDRLDAATLLAGRKKNAAGVKQFERLVAGAVDRATPVLWGVTLGIAPETPALPQAKGGHMRLIIGYNAKNRTIIYSDSWGAGHERKVMAADMAFAITNGMMALTP